MRLLLPSLIYSFSQFIWILADNIIAGNFIEDDALASITLCKPYLSLVTFFNMLIVPGMSIFFLCQWGKMIEKKPISFLARVSLWQPYQVCFFSFLLCYSNPVCLIFSMFLNLLRFIQNSISAICSFIRCLCFIPFSLQLLLMTVEKMVYHFRPCYVFL